MSNSMRFFSVFILASVLSACGGGDGNSSSSGTAQSNNSGSNSGTTTGSNTGNNSNNNNSAVVTAQCVEANSTVSVTATGCVTSGTNPQTAVCVASGSSQTLKMLTGTNKTASEVINGGSSFSGTAISINGMKYVCA